jgi:hypothetical protein
LRLISVQELREAIDAGEIIEDYRGDKYGPSCLIFGLTTANKPPHVSVVIVTSAVKNHYTLRTGRKFVD